MVFPQAGAASVARSATKSQVHRQLYMPAIATECQRQSGRRFATAAVIPQEHFRITKVEPKMFARRPVP